MAALRAPYRIHAYVCGQACVRLMENMGTVDFVWLFMNRPNDCRYAVVSQWNVARHAEDFLVFDMYEAQESLKSGKLVAPPPLRTEVDADTAIMATAMLYED